MSTWTCRRAIPAIGFALALALAGCDENGADFLGTSSSDGFDNPRRDRSLTSVELLDGALALVPPNGFCVDRGSWEPNFAILARCDSLGARRSVTDVPLGLIVVSVANPARPPDSLFELLARLLPAGAETMEGKDTADLALMRLRGATPEGADARHWRGLARIGPHLLSLAAFAPAGGELAGDAGGRVLEILVQRSRAATEERPVSIAATLPERRGPGAGRRGLSD